MLFLEIIKELPITLMTRPFGKDTLAIKIFEYTSESDWTNAAVPSLLLVCLGGIAVLIIYFKLKDKIN
jgi:iron(III) transport system permease protein